MIAVPDHAHEWLPLVFLGLMGLSMLAYVVLDGYDLGVGILLRRAGDTDKDTMLASIGPYWDANETWLVLGIGVLLVAFPLAHGVILTALYLPVAVMLIGLIVRGAAFDFRVKARDSHRAAWNTAFYAGSWVTAAAQGYMLGWYVLGFASGWSARLFAALIALCVVSGYTLMGAVWLVMRTEGDLQKRAVDWAQRSLWLTGAGILAVSVGTPWVSPRIFERWFSMPNLLLLAPVPLLTAALFALTLRTLARLPQPGDRHAWVPFACTVGMFTLAAGGLAYSTYPFLVVDRITAMQAASATESLWIVFLGVVVVLPFIIAYNVFTYRVFRGKARPLTYY
jgi:cytochrome bd ubiquinol oxidase subunit II